MKKIQLSPQDMVSPAHWYSAVCCYTRCTQSSNVDPGQEHRLSVCYTYRSLYRKQLLRPPVSYISLPLSSLFEHYDTMPSVREAHRYPDRDRGVFADSQYEQGQKFLSDTVMFSPEKLTAMSIYQAFLNLSKYDQNWYKGLTHTGELPAVYPPGEQAPKKEPTKQPKKASKKGSRKETKYSNEELNEGPSTQSKETRRAETKLDQYAIAIEQDNIQWISPTKKVERIPFLKTRPERAQEGALVVAIFHHNAYKIRDEDNIHDVYVY